MTVNCPTCGKENKVAGLLPPSPDSCNKSENYRGRSPIYCGFCGTKFDPFPEVKGGKPEAV